MAEPLALLGDTLAAVGGNYVAGLKEEKLHQRARTEHLADIQSARTYEQKNITEERKFQVDRTKDAWAHEIQVYKDRQYDHVKEQLMLDGYLRREDAGSDAAFAEALRKGAIERGPEYKRRLEEIALYKAQIPSIIAAAKGSDQAMISRVLDMTPDNIDEARQIMKTGYTSVAAKVQEDTKRGLLNSQNGALMLMANDSQHLGLFNQKATINADIDRLISGGNPTQPELDAATKAAVNDPLLSKIAAMNPLSRSKLQDQQLQAGIQKKLQDNALLAVSQKSLQLKSLDRDIADVTDRAANIRIAIDKGAAAFMKGGGVTEVADAALGGDLHKKPEVAAPGTGTAAYAAAAKAALQKGVTPKATGGTTGTPGVTQEGDGSTLPTPTPAAAGAPGYGGVLGFVGGLGKNMARGMDVVTDTAADAVIGAPNALRYAIGGQKLVDERLTGAPAPTPPAFMQRMSDAAGRATLGGASGNWQGQEGAVGEPPVTPPVLQPGPLRSSFDANIRSAGQLVDRLTPEYNLKPPPVVGDVVSSISPAQKAAEDSILARAPYSYQAMQIYRRRGIPVPTETPSTSLGQEPAFFGAGAHPPLPGR